MEKKYKDLAKEILKKVGGKENIFNVMHCMTRLRFNLKDLTIVDEDEIKSISGVLGCQNAAGEFQVIIGPTVPKVYEALCELGDLSRSIIVPENTDENLIKGKLTAKKVVLKCLDALSGSLAPLIPAFIIMGVMNLILAVFGPNILGVLGEDSDFYRIIYIVSQTVMYFIPMLIAYTASKKFHTNPIVSLLLAGIMLHPQFLSIVEAGEAFAIYGIPMKLVTYSSTVIPMILIIVAQSWIEKLLNKIVPDVISLLVVPASTVLLMLPIGLCVLGPLGQTIGEGFASLMIGIYEIAGPIETMVVGGVQMILIGTGMSYPIFSLMMANFFQTGVEFMYLPMAKTTLWAVMGAVLGFIIRSKSNEEKQLGIASFFAQLVSGVSEPAIFGILMNYPRVFLAEIIGGAAGGLYVGLMHVGFYVPGVSNFMSVLAFAGGEKSNLFHGIIACIISFVISFAAAMALGVGKKKKTK